MPAVRLSADFYVLSLVLFAVHHDSGLIWRPDLKDKDGTIFDWHPSIMFT